MVELTGLYFYFVSGTVIRFRYAGWSARYDEFVDLNNNVGFHLRCAPFRSLSCGDTVRLRHLKVRDPVEVQFEGKWVTGTVKKLHLTRNTNKIVSPQIQVVFSPEGYDMHRHQIRWFDRRDPQETARTGTHCPYKVSKNPMSPDHDIPWMERDCTQ